MKKIELNNIEENKFIMGYIHYINSKNKIVYKKAIGYIVPEEDMIFCMSSYSLNENNIQNMLYEKTSVNDKLYYSINNPEVFELKQYVYPNSDKKISSKVLNELIPLLEKYIIDEDFEVDDKLRRDYNIDTNKKLKKEIKNLMLTKTISKL